MASEALWLQAALQVPVLILAIEALRRGAPLVRDYVRQLEGLRADQDRANARLVGMLGAALGVSDPHGYAPDDPENHDGLTEPNPNAPPEPEKPRRLRRRKPPQ